MENDKGQDKTKSTKENVERKPSIKLKKAHPPPVRQTLTSYNRMLKANPLLRYQEAGIDIEEVFKLRGHSYTTSGMADSKSSCTLEGKTSIIREFKKPETKPLMRTQSLKLPKSNGVDTGGKKINIISSNQPLTNNLKRPPVNSINKNAVKHLAKPKAEITSRYLTVNRVEQKKHPVEIKTKVNSFPKNSNLLVPKESNKPKPKSQPKTNSSLRRSLSTGHIQTKKGTSFDPKLAYTIVNQSNSEDNINVPGTSNAPLTFTPILEESNESRNLVFKTPSAYERRSICHFTPRSDRKSSIFQASTPAPVELQRLQERLNKWLKSRGKPLASFHHLRCFGIEENNKKPSQINENDEENKENIEVIQEKSESFEDLKISVTPEASKADLLLDLPIKKAISEEELAKAAKEAMVELQKLIEEDYPRPQCLGWLELIREKYKKAVDEPEYWECRAAIEQSVGNVGNAVEFYKTAIIQGAEVTTVDKSLDQLLKKFSLLNITPNKSQQNKGDGNKERIIREARTVFKSTIIQFAIQERKLKKKSKETSSVESSKKFVATPVRRSTRVSRSGYISTPAIKLCQSLREIDLSSEEFNFEKNKALC